MKKLTVGIALLMLIGSYYAYTSGMFTLAGDINMRIDNALTRAVIDVSEYGGGSVVLLNSRATFSVAPGSEAQGLVTLAPKRAVVVKDDNADVFTIVTINGGGAGIFTYLAHFEYNGAQNAVEEVQRILLGDRIIIDDIVTEITSPTSYEVLVAFKERKPHEAMATAPTQSRVLTFGRGDHGLELHATVFGTLAEHDVVLVSPAPGATVPNTFTVRGAVRGPWYFEASFPIELRTMDGMSIATVIAQAQNVGFTKSNSRAADDWMTEELVPFSTTVIAPSTMHGPMLLILKKDNPSGLPEHDKSIVMPIIIE